ncbi:hypothetical protein OQA88_7321 [Cercophora sp. LCS_1]
MLDVKVGPPGTEKDPLKELGEGEKLEDSVERVLGDGGNVGEIVPGVGVPVPAGAVVPFVVGYGTDEGLDDDDNKIELLEVSFVVEGIPVEVLVPGTAEDSPVGYGVEIVLPTLEAVVPAEMGVAEAAAAVLFGIG